MSVMYVPRCNLGGDLVVCGGGETVLDVGASSPDGRYTDWLSSEQRGGRCTSAMWMVSCTMVGDPWEAFVFGGDQGLILIWCSRSVVVGWLGTTTQWGWGERTLCSSAAARHVGVAFLLGAALALSLLSNTQGGIYFRLV